VLAQRQFAGGAEALDHIVVDGDFFLGAAEGGEADPLVAKRLGNKLAHQRKLAGRAEPFGDIGIDGDLLLAAAEGAEPDPHVEKRKGDPTTQR